MNEEISFAFTSQETFDKLQIPAESELRIAVPIMNPLTDENPLLRTNLVGSILENAARNFSRKNEDVKLFEIAPVFFPKNLPVTEQPEEVQKLVGLIMALHPGKTAVFKKGKEILATVGEVHPAVAENFGIGKKVFVFEADIATLMKYTAKKFSFEQLPKYPAISRDLAILVDKNISAGEVEKVITKSAGKFFSGVNLFDVYTGDRISADKKSLAFAIKFQSNERTLKDEEADDAFKNILSQVEKNFGAELRS